MKPKCKTENYKIKNKHIKENLHDPEEGKEFLKITSKILYKKKN